MFSHMNRCSTPDLEVNVSKKVCLMNEDEISNLDYSNWKDQIEECPEVFYICPRDESSLHAVKYFSEFHPVEPPPKELDKSIRISYEDVIMDEEANEQLEKERNIFRESLLMSDNSDTVSATSSEDLMVTTSAVDAFFNLNLLNIQGSSESDLSIERIERDVKTI